MALSAAAAVLGAAALVVACMALREQRRERKHERDNEAVRERGREVRRRRQDQFNRDVAAAFFVCDHYRVEPPRISDLPPDQP